MGRRVGGFGFSGGVVYLWGCGFAVVLGVVVGFCLRFYCFFEVFVYVFLGSLVCFG